MGLSSNYIQEIKSACQCHRQFHPFDTNGKTVDLAASFCPTNTIALLWKGCMGPFSVFFLIYVWATEDYPGWFLAALTYWGLLISTLYMISSFVCTFSAKILHYYPVAVDNRVVSAWILFAMASTLEVVIVILYWVLVYDPDKSSVTFKNVGIHGFMLAIVVIDGLLVNRIPLRMQQWFTCVFPISSLYVIWSAIHSATNIGNPNDTDNSNDPDTNNDLIYQVIDWQDETWSTLVLCIIIIFVVSPLIYSVMWYLSQARGRRLYIEGHSPQQEGYALDQKGAEGTP